MLTDSEREWVIENKTRNGCIYARRCRYTCFEPPYCPVIPTKEDLIDALEFSERVAAKLAECMDYRVPCASTDECNTSKLSCAECRLKIARLAVEEQLAKFDNKLPKFKQIGLWGA